MSFIDRNVPGSGYGNVYTDALIWGGAAWSTWNTVKVYFGQAADYWDAWNKHGDSAYVDETSEFADWTLAEANVFVEVLELYASVCGLTFSIADSAADANIVWWKTDLGPEAVGVHEAPIFDQGSNQTWGYFNPLAPSWNNLEFGGDGRHTIIHELGHGFGLAHPHDGGTQGDGTTFPGVPKGVSSATGDHGLNQGVWTVMSYNTGWDATNYDISFGAQGGLGAFDIAAFQALYGKNMQTAQGSNLYGLPTSSPYVGEEGWFCIWDAGGSDAISAAGARSSVVIDLRPATLISGDPNAGGFISQENGVAGGFTIANGVTIESAVGGNGGDELIGNDAANTLLGNGGSDILWGDRGNDLLYGDSGKDYFALDTRPSRSSNKDRIADYSAKDDTIWLDNLVFTKLGKGSYDKPVKIKSDMFVKASKAKDREDRIIYDSKKGVLSYDADGTGSKYKMIEFASIKKGLSLTHHDFFVV
jgi:serralysin